MSKRVDPITSIWHGSLVLLGSTIALCLTVELLTSIWPWLLGIAVIAAVAFALSAWLRARRNNW